MKEKNLSLSVLEIKTGSIIHSIKNILTGELKTPEQKFSPAIAEALECTLLDFIEFSSSSSNSWKGNNIMNKKNNYLEHPVFMAACADVVASLLEEKTSILFFDDYFDIIKTLYFYSLPKEPRIPDVKFAKWLLEEQDIISGNS